MPKKTIVARGVTYEMTPEEFDRFVERSGKLAYNMVGRIIKRNIRDDKMTDLIDKAMRRARTIERKKMKRELRRAGKL